MTREKSMRNTFNGYRKRNPNKSVEDAINYTRKWIEGEILKMGEKDTIPLKDQKDIENILNKLRIEG